MRKLNLLCKLRRVFFVCRMRLGVRGHRLPRRMRPSQSRIPRAVSVEHPLPVSDHVCPASLHRHQLHGGAASLQVSARPQVRPSDYRIINGEKTFPWILRQYVPSLFTDFSAISVARTQSVFAFMRFLYFATLSVIIILRHRAHDREETSF